MVMIWSASGKTPLDRCDFIQRYEIEEDRDSMMLTIGESSGVGDKVFEKISLLEENVHMRQVYYEMGVSSLVSNLTSKRNGAQYIILDGSSLTRRYLHRGIRGNGIASAALQQLFTEIVALNQSDSSFVWTVRVGAVCVQGDSITDLMLKNKSHARIIKPTTCQFTGTIVFNGQRLVHAENLEDAISLSDSLCQQGCHRDGHTVISFCVEAYTVASTTKVHNSPTYAQWLNFVSLGIDPPKANFREAIYTCLARLGKTGVAGWHGNKMSHFLKSAFVPPANTLCDSVLLSLLTQYGPVTQGLRTSSPVTDTYREALMYAGLASHISVVKGLVDSYFKTNIQPISDSFSESSIHSHSGPGNSRNALLGWDGGVRNALSSRQTLNPSVTPQTLSPQQLNFGDRLTSTEQLPNTNRTSIQVPSHYLAPAEPEDEEDPYELDDGGGHIVKKNGINVLSPEEFYAANEVHEREKVKKSRRDRIHKKLANASIAERQSPTMKFENFNSMKIPVESTPAGIPNSKKATPLTSKSIKGSEDYKQLRLEFDMYQRVMDKTVLRLRNDILNLQQNEQILKTDFNKKIRIWKKERHELHLSNRELRSATKRVQELESHRSQLQGEFHEELVKLDRRQQLLVQKQYLNTQSATPQNVTSENNFLQRRIGELESELSTLKTSQFNEKLSHEQQQAEWNAPTVSTISPSPRQSIIDIPETLGDIKSVVSESAPGTRRASIAASHHPHSHSRRQRRRSSSTSVEAEALTSALSKIAEDQGHMSPEPKPEQMVWFLLFSFTSLKKCAKGKKIKIKKYSHHQFPL